MDKIFVITETFEGSDYLREFNILATSFDKELLRKIMRKKIEEDEYGIINSNGITIDDEDNFETVYSEGFLGYSISEEDII